MKSTILYAILSLTSLLSAAPTRAESLGHEGGNGGDEVAVLFQNAAVRAFEQIENNLNLGISVDTQLLRKTLAEASIIVVEEPLFVEIGGVKQPSIAVNVPASGTIFVHRYRWLSLTNLHLEEAVALHEVLSLELLERTGYYKTSGAYAENFNLTPEDLLRGFDSKTIVKCFDYENLIFTVSLESVAEGKAPVPYLRTSVTPVSREAKARLALFLAPLGIPLDRTEEAAGISFRAPLANCKFSPVWWDVADRSLFECIDWHQKAAPADPAKIDFKVRFKNGDMENVPLAEIGVDVKVATRSSHPDQFQEKNRFGIDAFKDAGRKINGFFSLEFNRRSCR
jgi:hypothetical protein